RSPTWLEGNELACLLVHGNPDPERVRLLLHKAPQLVCLHLQPPKPHFTGGRNGLHVPMLWQCRKAGGDKVPELPETDTNSAADAVQGDVLAESAFHHHAVFFVHHPLGGSRDKLTATHLATGIPLPGVKMAVFLELPGSTRRIRVSYAPGCSPPSA